MPEGTTIIGTSGNDVLSGGNGQNTIYGREGDDIISGGNGVDRLFGEAGDDQLTGDNGADYMTGGEDDDLLNGKLGFDTAYYSGAIGEYSFFYSSGYLNIVHLGGAGIDGHDQVINVERLVFADRIINIGSGANAPVAGDDHVFTDEDVGTYSSGAASVLDNDFDFDGDALTATGGTFVGTYGTLTLNSDGTYSYALNASAQQLAVGDTVTDSFDYTVSDNDGSDTGALVFHIDGINDGPVANPDTGAASENGSAILVDVLANDTDVDNGAVLTVTAASAPAGQGSASVVGNQVEYDPGTDFESLAEGETVDVPVSYSIADEHGATASSTVTVTVTGTNDGPVANPDTDTTSENAAILTDVLANDTDVDNGAVLTVTAASAPAGQGSASVVGNQVEFDPGTDFDDLAVGETEEVIVTYDMTDEHGATDSATVTITVTGENDTPVANPDTATTNAADTVAVSVLANDTDVDNQAVLALTTASVPAGQGSVSINEDGILFDPGTDFDYLAPDETAEVVVTYEIADEHGATASSTVTITVEGRDDAPPSGTPTEGPDTLVGSSGNDTIDALGGDDIVSGRSGDDILFGRGGNDHLDGEGGNDVVEGGDGEDALLGGTGSDDLSGQAGNDSVFGEDGDDLLSGGGGFDVLLGDAGADTIVGGAQDDVLSGGDDNDQLAGDAGFDTLFGDAGDDALDGGEGNDFLHGGGGADSYVGGLGDDEIVASAADGIQTIDGGADNDGIHVSTRNFASTITTGTGSDTIDLLEADVGTAEVTVTDFTAGAGGDKVQLSDLLGLLDGWDGSSNPFGSGFLRLEQSGADTLLQWDRNGATDGAVWETLAVLENTDAGDFTEANFVPAYHPDGSAPAGTTITGTPEDDTLTGTFADDTIDALGGNDSVSGGDGADLILGGDGFDLLIGEAGDDTIEGGIDDDVLSGEGGNDQLSGQLGNDFLDGGEGENTLDGGDGDDFLSGGLGADQLSGGAGTDTIRVSTRDFASTITTGTGSDTIELFFAHVGSEAITVTDFTPGAGGDVVQLAGLLSRLEGWDGNANPFGSDFLRLTQDGTDTLFEWDRDGTESASDWETLLVLENTTATAFTGDNFVPSYDPGGAAPVGETITGTAGDDTLVGTIGDDTIDALGGNDAVYGDDGADVITGGDGFDLLIGQDGDDTIDGGIDDDVLSGEAGTDQLTGGAGSDYLFGGDDADVLDGGDGSDLLFGEGGADLFHFASAAHGPDELSDFESGMDQISISASGFGGGLTAGGTVSLVSGSDPTASGAGGQFLYDTDDGRLLWDADGSGTGAAVLFATLPGLPALAASDFVVV